LTSVARATTGIWTVITDEPNLVAVGDEITISGVVDASSGVNLINGNWTILGVTNGTTFTVQGPTGVTAISPADELDTDGNVYLPARSREVTALPDEVTTASLAGLNVPGSVEFNADDPIDYVLKSTEDPTS
jgi:hypothetical protein